MAVLERVGVRPVRVGLVAGGLGAYWPQFAELLPQLRRSAECVSDRLRGLGGVELVDVGFISDEREGAAAAERLRTAGCDLIVGFLTTYMTASMLVPVAQRCGAPVLLVNLQPTERMDHETFDTGAWLAYCGACPLPEMANAFERAGVEFRSVSGYLADERAWARIGRWVRAAGIRGALRHARHGLMGHLYPGMLDVSTDLPQVVQLEHLDVTAELAGHRPMPRPPTGSRWPATCSPSTSPWPPATSTGPPGSPSGWTASSRTSRWTASPTTTAAWPVSSTNGSAPG